MVWITNKHQQPNYRFRRHHHNHNRRLLRATPHAVSLKYHDDESFARVCWYGRMILPPNDVCFRCHERTMKSPPPCMQTTWTYGVMFVVDWLVETPDEYIPAGLGCSSSTPCELCNTDRCDHTWGRISVRQRILILLGTVYGPDRVGLNRRTVWRTELGIEMYQSIHEDNFPLVKSMVIFFCLYEYSTTLEVTPYPEIPQKEASMCSSSSDWELFMTTG